MKIDDSLELWIEDVHLYREHATYGFRAVIEWPDGEVEVMSGDYPIQTFRRAAKYVEEEVEREERSTCPTGRGQSVPS